MCCNCLAGVDRKEAITHRGCRGCPLSGALEDSGADLDEGAEDFDELELLAVGMK